MAPSSDSNSRKSPRKSVIKAIHCWPAEVIINPLAGTRVNRSYPVSASNASIAAVIELCEIFMSVAAAAIEPVRPAAST